MHNKTVIKVLFVVLGVLVVIGGVLIYFAFSKYQEIKTDPAKVFQGIDPIMAPTPENTSTDDNKEEPKPSQTSKIITIDKKQYKQKKEILNILFLGIDTNKERIIEKKGFRSDMVMLCALDIKNNAATLISIPRDTYTKVSKVNETTGQVTGTEMNKINAAYAYGHGKDKYSFQNSIRAVEDFMNIEQDFSLDIRYYAGIDIDGIPKVASALGGVSVTLEEGFPGIGKAGQTVTLKGQNAIDFVRERKNVGGDLGRTRRQQLFMMAIAKKIQKLGALQAAPKIFGQVSSFTSTNFTVDEVAGLAIILDKMDVGKIKHITIEGSSTRKDGMYCILADENSIRNAMLETYFDPA